MLSSPSSRGGCQIFDLGQRAAIHACNKKRALELLSNHCRRIKPSANSADIRRSFRASKQGYIGGFKYIHIYGHMDQFLPWNQLSLMQQLNCVCNTLAKKALLLAIISGYHDRPTQILLREDVALVIWGNKVTGDISTPLHSMQAKK